jgi:hypothetical protein
MDPVMVALLVGTMENLLGYGMARKLEIVDRLFLLWQSG